MTNPEEPTTDATKVTDAPNVSSSAEEKDGDTVFFEDLDLSDDVLDALYDMRFEKCTPVQARCIPPILEGRDVLGVAQTGTGKTAAYLLPLLTLLAREPHPEDAVNCLVVAPTRELARQIDQALQGFSYYAGIRSVAVYGGNDGIRYEQERRSFSAGADIVLATPGRLITHLQLGNLDLSRTTHLVLDEADRMLDMGFAEDIMTIVKQMPKERQTVLFSATMPRPILSLTKKYMRAPKNVTVSKEELTVPLIEQYYFETKDKVEGLCRLLDAEIDGKLIIFCRTKKGVDDLSIALSSRGYMAEGLHGDLSQNQRDRVMKKFREGACDVLIATDVAARGIDIDNITHVINFDIPQDPESYVHRIGRTGRAGNTGVAMTFITPREFRQLKLIERMVKTKIQRRQLPTAANVIERQRDQIISKMQTVLELNAYHDYMPIAESLLDDYSAEEVAAAALKLMQEGVKALEAPQEDVLAKDLQNTGGRPGMVRLFMNVGRSQKIMVKDIVSTIAIEADIPARDIGLINIYDKFTFVEVPEDVAEKVIGAMHKNFIKGYRVNIEPAKVRERR